MNERIANTADLDASFDLELPFLGVNLSYDSTVSVYVYVNGIRSLCYRSYIAGN